MPSTKLSTLLSHGNFHGLITELCGNTPITVQCTESDLPYTITTPTSYIISFPVNLIVLTPHLNNFAASLIHHIPASAIDNYDIPLLIFLHELGHTQTNSQSLPDVSHYTQPRERAATKWALDNYGRTLDYIKRSSL